jgi:hypothetical protein
MTMNRDALFARFETHRAGGPGWSKVDHDLVVVWCDVYASDEHLACWLAVVARTRREAEQLLRDAGVHQLKLAGPSRPPISDDLLKLACGSPGRIFFQIADGQSSAAELAAR